MAYVPSRRKRHDTFIKNAKLNLTSMMDMFTIILVFLLKTYTTEGNLIQPTDALTLPKSKVQSPPEVALDLVVSREMVTLNDKPVVAWQEVQEQKGFVIEPLKEELLYYATEAKRLEAEMGAAFSGKIIIQGDKDIEYKDLVKVMATCGVSDYPNMRLVVYQTED